MTVDTAHATGGQGAGLVVDPDLTAMIGDVLAGFSGPTVEPDPVAVWRTLTEVGLARLTAPEGSGGSGAGWAEAAALIRQAAASGVCVPYVETDVVVGPLRRAASLDDTSPGTSTLAVVGPGGRAWGARRCRAPHVRGPPRPGGPPDQRRMPRVSVPSPSQSPTNTSSEARP